MYCIFQESYVLRAYGYEAKKLSPKKSLKISPTKQRVVKLGKVIQNNPIKESFSGNAFVSEKLD